MDINIEGHRSREHCSRCSEKLDRPHGEYAHYVISRDFEETVEIEGEKVERGGKGLICKDCLKESDDVIW